MQFIDPFREFDPINGELKGPFPPILSDIVNRARKFVDGRSRKQIEFAVSSINYILNYIHQSEIAETNQNNESDISNIDNTDALVSQLLNFEAETPDFGPGRVLLGRIERFDINKSQN